MSLIALFRSFTIRARMLGAIAAVLILLCMVGAGGLNGLLQLQAQSTAFIQGTHQDLVRLGDLRNELGNVRRYEKDMVINHGSAQDLPRYQSFWVQSIESAQATAKALAAQQGGQEAEEALSVAQHLEDYRKSLLAGLAGTQGQAMDAVAVNAELEPARKLIRQIEVVIPKLSEHLAAEAVATAAERERVTRQAFILLGAAFVLAAVVVVPLTLVNMVSIARPLDDARHLAEEIAAGNLTTEGLDASGQDEAARLMRALARMQESLRHIVGQVRASTDSITTASSQIAAGNMDLSSRTEQAASSLQQTAASVEQISGTVQHSAESARQANELAASAAGVASRGGSVVGEVVHTMQEIQASSAKMADIIGVIDGIAFQTNILALNAAVEAARAGEQGRGFAVVAGEVRALAQRSAAAAREIKALIDVSVGKVDNGSRLVSQAGATMDEIVASVQRVSGIINEISHAASQQSAGVGEVNRAVSNLDQVTQQNAALVEQSAAAAQSLRDQAGHLGDVVGQFRLPGTVH